MRKCNVLFNLGHMYPRCMLTCRLKKFSLDIQLYSFAYHDARFICTRATFWKKSKQTNLDEPSFWASEWVHSAYKEVSAFSFLLEYTKEIWLIVSWFLCIYLLTGVTKLHFIHFHNMMGACPITIFKMLEGIGKKDLGVTKQALSF